MRWKKFTLTIDTYTAESHLRRLPGVPGVTSGRSSRLTSWRRGDCTVIFKYPSDILTFGSLCLGHGDWVGPSERSPPDVPVVLEETP